MLRRRSLAIVLPRQQREAEDRVIQANRAYGAMHRRTVELRRARKRYAGRPKHLAAWMRLTHEGARFPEWPECYRCGEVMTAVEIDEYNALMASGSQDSDAVGTSA